MVIARMFSALALLFVFLTPGYNQKEMDFPQQIKTIRELMDHGQAYQASDLIQSTIQQYNKSPRKKQDKKVLIELTALKGKVQYDLSNYPESLATLAEAGKLAAKSLSKHHPLGHEISNYQAITYYEMNFTIRSKQLCDSLVNIYSRQAPTLELAYTYELLGSIYGLDLQYERSKQMFEKSLTIRALLAKNEGMPVIRSYMGLATYYLEIGDLRTAYDYLQKGLDKLKRWPNPALEGRYYQILGNVYRGISDIPTAEQYLQQAQTLIEGVRPKYHPSLLMLKNVMASARADAQDYEGAIQIYKEALEVFNTSPAYKDTSYLVVVYANFGLNYYQLGNRQASHASMDTAFMLLKSQEYKDFTAPAMYLWVSRVLANIYYGEGKYTEAKKTYLDQITKIEATYGSESPFLITPLNNLGNTHDELGEFDDAIVCYSKALQIAGWQPEAVDPFSKIIQPFESSYTIWNRSVCYTKMAKLSNYNDNIQKASTGFIHYLDFLDYMRNGSREADSKLVTAADNRMAYDFALDCLHKQHPLPANYAAQVFSIIERSRSLVLYDGFRQQGRVDFPGLEQIQQREEALRQKIQAVQNVVEQAKQSRLLPESDNQKIAAEYFLAKTDFYKFLDSLKTTHRSYYELKYGTTKITLEDTQKKLASTHSGMLMYYVGEEQLTSILITADSAWVNYQPIDSTFEETVNLFVANIQSENQLSQYEETAVKLYNILLKPWKKHNRLPVKLSIVPEGVLLNIPFEALLTERPKVSHAIKSFPFVVFEHVISYDFSSSMDQATCEKRHSNQPIDSTLAFAPFYLDSTGKLPVYYAELNIEDESTTRAGFQLLPYSGAEVYGVGKQSPTNAVYGKSATKSAFLNSYSNYRQLYISSHAQSNDHPDNSFIVFSSDNPAQEYDSLYAREVYGLSINADDVVLSGCQTGVGGQLSGEGVASLARAFTYAGAKSVVYTLWKVDDKSTANILVDYWQKKAKTPKDQALANAKAHYIRNVATHRMAHPRNWAGILISGNVESGD